MRVAGFERSDGNAVVIENAITRVSGDAIARHDDADEVQRIGGAYRDHAVLRTLAAYRAQHPNRLRQCKLFSRDTGNKAAAADFTARFQTMIRAQQHAPRQRQAFAFEQTFEDDTITLQEG